MVQWLKPCTSNTVGTGSILGQGTKIPWVTCAKKEKKRQSSVNLGSDSLAAQRELGSSWRPDPSCPAGAQHVCVWPPAQTSPPPTPTDSCPVLSSSAHSLQGDGDWERPQVPGGHLEGTGRAAGSEGALDNTLLPGRGSWGEGHGHWPGLGEGGPGGEWGSTLGADAGAELLKADSKADRPSQSCIQKGGCGHWGGDHSCQEREAGGPRSGWSETSGDVSALHKIPNVGCPL